MALNASGPISLAGTTTGQSIEVELGGTGSTAISLNDTNVRTLAGVASGAITMPVNFWGKSSSNARAFAVSFNNPAAVFGLKYVNFATGAPDIVTSGAAQPFTTHYRPTISNSTMGYTMGYTRDGGAGYNQLTVMYLLPVNHSTKTLGTILTLSTGKNIPYSGNYAALSNATKGWFEGGQYNGSSGALSLYAHSFNMTTQAVTSKTPQSVCANNTGGWSTDIAAWLCNGLALSGQPGFPSGGLNNQRKKNVWATNATSVVSFSGGRSASTAGGPTYGINLGTRWNVSSPAAYSTPTTFTYSTEAVGAIGFTLTNGRGSTTFCSQGVSTPTVGILNTMTAPNVQFNWATSAETTTTAYDGMSWVGSTATGSFTP
jgi:hypothetical protein